MLVCPAPPPGTDGDDVATGSICLGRPSWTDGFKHDVGANRSRRKRSISRRRRRWRRTTSSGSSSAASTSEQGGFTCVRKVDCDTKVTAELRGAIPLTRTCSASAKQDNCQRACSGKCPWLWVQTRCQRNCNHDCSDVCDCGKKTAASDSNQHVRLGSMRACQQSPVSRRQTRQLCRACRAPTVCERRCWRNRAAVAG